MKKDKNIKKIIKELNDMTKYYLDYVNDLNECAYTDRIIERIIKQTLKLKKEYEKEVV